jgi:hypothetical protein
VITTTNRTVGAVCAIALAVLTHGQVFAQTTWHDLRFGMTETEVKAQLGNGVNRPVPDDQTDVDHPSYVGWEVLIEVEHIPGKALILFDKKTHRCTGVDLDLDPAKLVGAVKKSISVKALLESLENKYGNPFRTEDGLITKATTWRTKDQIVECRVLFVRDMPDVIFIRYRPKSKDI